MVEGGMSNVPELSSAGPVASRVCICAGNPTSHDWFYPIQSFRQHLLMHPTAMQSPP